MSLNEPKDLPFSDIFRFGTGEMAQQLRALAALAEDLGSVPSTHIGQLTTVCDSSSRNLMHILQSVVHTHTNTKTDKRVMITNAFLDAWYT